MRKTIALFDSNAILDARFPPPAVRARRGPASLRRLSAVNALWGSTLGAEPAVVVWDDSAPTAGPSPVDPEAVEGALSAYAWHGLQNDTAYTQVLDVLLSGLCGQENCAACAALRDSFVAMVDAYFA